LHRFDAVQRGNRQTDGKTIARPYLKLAKHFAVAQKRQGLNILRDRNPESTKDANGMWS